MSGELFGGVFGEAVHHVVVLYEVTIFRPVDLKIKCYSLKVTVPCLLQNVRPKNLLRKAINVPAAVPANLKKPWSSHSSKKSGSSGVPPGYAASAEKNGAAEGDSNRRDVTYNVST